MFDPLPLTHDELMQRVREATDLPTVANAFVISLSSRQLEIRWALGSFAFLRHFPIHPAPAAGAFCPACGYRDSHQNGEDLNVLNFERFKWGGVRHGQPLYAMLDLEQFVRRELPAPSPEDVRVLRDLLDALSNAPPNATAATLHGRLSGVFKSNTVERDMLIGILGLCGITARNGLDANAVATVFGHLL